MQRNATQKGTVGKLAGLALGDKTMVGKTLWEENPLWSPLPLTQKRRNCLGHFWEQLSLHLACQHGVNRFYLHLQVTQGSL